MKTFHWKPQKSFTTSINPRVKTIKFGDGYEQRFADGINTDLRSYNLTFKVMRDDYPYLDVFLKEHGGYKAFRWREPNTFKYVTVKCESWSVSTELTVVTVNAVFQEVVA